MTPELVILLITSILMSFLSLIVYVRNLRSPVGKSFLALTITVIVWLVTNYIADFSHNNTINEWATRLAFVAAACIGFAILTFSYIFPINRFNNRTLSAILVTSLSFAIFSGTSLVTTGITRTAGETGIGVITGPLYLWYIVIFVATILFAIRNLLRGYRTENALKRNQVRVIVLGVALSTAFGAATNLVLPVVANDWSTSRLAPVVTLFFIGSLAYAIVRHRFLDIRLIVTRSVAYVLLLGTLIATYALVVFAASSLLLDDSTLSFGQQAFYLVVALLLALSMPPLKRFFDKATRAVFYRDSYVTKDVLDKMSALLVSAISLEKVVTGSLKILNQAIKPQNAGLVITQGKSVRFISSRSKTKDLPPRLLEHLTQSPRSILVLDELEDTTANNHLRTELREAGIAAAARLQTPQEHIGFLVFGYKQNGSMFSGQDVELVRIAAEELSVAIQNALRFEEIAQFNITLKKEIAAATTELRESNRRLRELDKAKDEFLSMASHQLRTPLTSVKGYLSMTLEGDAGKLNDAQQHLLNESYKSAQRMVYLVNDFLNVSRIKTGKFTVDAAPVVLGTLVREEVEQLLGTAKVRNITLTQHIDADIPRMQLDVSKVRQVVMNLIDNAIYYSKPDTEVIISLTHNEGWVTFTVQDHGIGVPKDEQSHMFEKFFRASNAKKVRSDGTGVGLYVANKVIAVHGGDMIFSSQQGKGSTFGFKLPVKPVAATAQTSKRLA